MNITQGPAKRSSILVGVLAMLVVLVVALPCAGCCREFKPCPGQEPEPPESALSNNDRAAENR